MVRRVLVANRGEIALRIIRACEELGIESVAVYSDADRQAPHVQAADRAVRLGPAPATESYLAIDRILDAARASGADAVHPGYGFLSENSAFAEACARAGLIFVGPPASSIARMGSKIQARRLAADAGAPIVPGETPTDQSDSGVRAAVERIGLPALIKASAGGGGKGMRRVASAEEIDEAIRAARREATASFGDGTLYVERLIDRPHHVEVQIFADSNGEVVHLFERECSLQRRHQKIIEETPSPLVTPALRARMTAAAVAIARAAGYRNAGTIEFLVETNGAAFYFLEMNTRLQVEHPVTEQLTGVDLVRAQLLVASGEPLPWRQDAITARGHAIEARVYAEDAEHGFLPQAGRLTSYREPRRPGVRVDSGVAEGGEIPVHYDPMIAKVIASAETRPLAINRLAAALRDFDLAGVRTNLPFLLKLLELQQFRDGLVDTAFLDREAPAIARTISYAPPSAIENLKSAIRNPQSLVSYDPWSLPSLLRSGARASTRQAPAATASRPRATTAGMQTLAAPMPATVVKVHVKPGDTVKKGDTILVLEAMKMELPIRAPGDARIAAVCCREGELVQADTTLVELA
jgi:acetyl-CoA carboxylase biotin carboxylase subunit